MAPMGAYDQVKKAFQDIIAPELYTLRGEIQRVDANILRLDQRIDGMDQKLAARIDGLDQKLTAKIEGVDQKLAARIDGLDQKLDDLDVRLNVRLDSLRTETVSMKGELLAEIRRVDARIDGVDRELRTAIDVRERLAALEARRAGS